MSILACLGGLAFGVGMQGDDALEEHCLRVRDVLDGLDLRTRPQQAGHAQLPQGAAVVAGQLLGGAVGLPQST